MRFWGGICGGEVRDEFFSLGRGVSSPDLRRGFSPSLRCPPIYDDASTFRCQPLRDRKADACSGTCYQRQFVVEFEVHAGLDDPAAAKGAHTQLAGMSIAVFL